MLFLLQQRLLIVVVVRTRAVAILRITIVISIIAVRISVFIIILFLQNQCYRWKSGTETYFLIILPALIPPILFRLRNDLYCVEWDVKP